MFFHHNTDPEKLFHQMEESGYDSLSPAIEPEKLRAICEKDPTLLEVYKQMITYCKRYAHDIFNMMHEQALLADLREKGEDTPEMYQELQVIDHNRHNLHEAMMDSVNLMSRELAKRNEDIEWMREVVAGGRASYAKFAILTFYKIYSNIIIPSQIGSL